MVWKYIHHYSSIVTGFHSFILFRIPSFILVYGRTPHTARLYTYPGMLEFILVTSRVSYPNILISHIIDIYSIINAGNARNRGEQRAIVGTNDYISCKPILNICASEVTDEELHCHIIHIWFHILDTWEHIWRVSCSSTDPCIYRHWTNVSIYVAVCVIVCHISSHIWYLLHG